jgi:hypothetical protein
MKTALRIIFFSVVVGLVMFFAAVVGTLFPDVLFVMPVILLVSFVCLK